MENYAASAEGTTSGYLHNAQKDAHTPVYAVPGTAPPKPGYDQARPPVPVPNAQVRGPELQAQPWVRSRAES